MELGVISLPVTPNPKISDNLLQSFHVDNGRNGAELNPMEPETQQPWPQAEVAPVPQKKKAFWNFLSREDLDVSLFFSFY